MERENVLKEDPFFRWILLWKEGFDYDCDPRNFVSKGVTLDWGSS